MFDIFWEQPEYFETRLDDAIELIKAYVPNADYMTFSDAYALAALRDEEAAYGLERSALDA
jgi:hypothetical protein